MVEVEYICTSCGNLIKPKTQTKGSFWMEVLLWMLFILPGLLYSLTRLGNKVYVCPICGKDTVIPTNTPVGQKLLKEYNKTPKDTQEEKPDKIVNLAKIMIFAITGLIIFMLLGAVLLGALLS